MPSFGADAALLSHANGPDIFRDCVCGAGRAFAVVFDEVPPHDTPGSEAEKPVKREGGGGGLAKRASVGALHGSEGMVNGLPKDLAEGTFAESSCGSASFWWFVDPVDTLCALCRGSFILFSD